VLRRLHPEPVVDVGAYDAYRPADPAAPLVRLNMVASLDGAFTDSTGRSGGLGGDADLEVFRALRAHADAILVGAGTARAEGYGPHRLHRDVAGPRRADGRPAPAAVAVVSARLDLDPAAPLFIEASTPTIVLTSASAPTDRRRALERVARVVVAGDERVDARAALDALRALGCAHVLCEGGPSLNGTLLDADVVEELCLTVAPTFVPEGRHGIVSGHAAGRRLALLAVHRGDDELLLRYTVERDHHPSGG
jgi:riboflavin-specific deaminase-like protein